MRQLGSQDLYNVYGELFDDNPKFYFEIVAFL